jgi:hypothetical protein
MAITLSVASWAPAQTNPAPSGLGGSTAPRDVLSDAQIGLEVRRLNTMKMECLAQAHQLLAAQKAASAGGRLSEAEAYGKTLKDKIACMDKANQDLLQLQAQMDPAKARLFATQDRFHQEYHQGLQAHLGTLQGFNEHLANPDAVTYEPFAQQMNTFQRQLDTFRNRYIRLRNEPETQEFAKTLFQAGDLLTASVQAWKQQLKAEREIRELTPNGPSRQLSRSQAARDSAVEQRAGQWATVQRLVTQATALAATR